MNKKDKECCSTMRHEEVTKEEEDMEAKIKDEEEVRLCAIIVINQDIFPKISRIPVRPISIVM